MTIEFIFALIASPFVISYVVELITYRGSK